MAFLSFNDGGSPMVTNLLKWSEDLTHASGWGSNAGGTASTPTVTANYATAPDGSMTANRVQLALNGGTASADFCNVNESYTAVVGLSYTPSLWIKTTDGSTKLVQIIGASVTGGVKTVTGTWQRLSGPAWVATGTTGTMTVRLRGSLATSDSADLLVWGGMVNVGAYATAYIPTTSAALSAASLHCDYPGTVASRFSGWTPTTRPVGDSVNRLSDGGIVMFKERTDYGASFTLEGIPVKALTDSVNRVAIADRLIAHLLSGGTCLVQTDDVNQAIYKTCGLWPGSSPSLTLTDRSNLLYSLSLQLVNLASTPVAMTAVYAG